MKFLKKLDEREIVIYKKLKEIQKSNFKKSDLDKVGRNIFHFMPPEKPVSVPLAPTTR